MSVATAAPMESKFHVLAVDDSLTDRKVIERLLKISSYQVTTVDSGSKALEFLGLNEDDEQSSSETTPVSPNNHHQEMEVNLIITDYCMPGMTGYDLLKKIKESSSLKTIPVVIMSSEKVPSRITRCLEEGAEEFLFKPVRLSDVNKLKSHMMKTKLKNQNQNQENQQISEKSEIQLYEKLENQSSQKQQPEIQPMQSQTLNDNSKRKAMDEGVSPDRRRPRYNGVIV